MFFPVPVSVRRRASDPTSTKLKLPFSQPIGAPQLSPTSKLAPVSIIHRTTFTTSDGLVPPQPFNSPQYLDFFPVLASSHVRGSSLLVLLCSVSVKSPPHLGISRAPFTMVNARNVAFRVDKQSPTQGPPPAALGTVINCRNSTVKRKSRAAQSVPSQQVVLKVATSSKKRKRDSNGPSEAPEYGNSKSPKISTGTSPGSHTPPGTPPTTSLSSPSNALGQHDSSMKPFRRKPGKGFTGDTSLPWPTLLEAVHPAHLLEWRKLPVFWEFLHKYKHIWTNSRIHHYGEEIPSPTPEIDEFQFADLRHGTGCQKCKAKGTRKTYWAFLRRWCKDCFQAETIKVITWLLSRTSTWIADLKHRLRRSICNLVPSWEILRGFRIGSASFQQESWTLGGIILVQDPRRATPSGPSTGVVTL